MAAFIAECDDVLWQRALLLVLLGLNHEQQHRELILTDIKHALSMNAFDPVYREAEMPVVAAQPQGLVRIRRRRGAGRHGWQRQRIRIRIDLRLRQRRPAPRRVTAPYCLASQPVSCGEYLAFIADDGYARPEFWLPTAGLWRARRDGKHRSTGAAKALASGASSRCTDGVRSIRTRRSAMSALYEAAAFAAWAGARHRPSREGGGDPPGLPTDTGAG